MLRCVQLLEDLIAALECDISNQTITNNSWKKLVTSVNTNCLIWSCTSKSQRDIDINNNPYDGNQATIFKQAPKNMTATKSRRIAKHKFVTEILSNYMDDIMKSIFEKNLNNKCKQYFIDKDKCQIPKNILLLSPYCGDFSYITPSSVMIKSKNNSQLDENKKQGLEERNYVSGSTQEILKCILAKYETFLAKYHKIKSKSQLQTITQGFLANKNDNLANGLNGDKYLFPKISIVLIDVNCNVIHCLTDKLCKFLRCKENNILCNIIDNIYICNMNVSQFFGNGIVVNINNNINININTSKNKCGDSINSMSVHPSIDKNSTSVYDLIVNDVNNKAFVYQSFFWFIDPFGYIETINPLSLLKKMKYYINTPNTIMENSLNCNDSPCLMQYVNHEIIVNVMVERMWHSPKLLGNLCQLIGLSSDWFIKEKEENKSSNYKGKSVCFIWKNVVCKYYAPIECSFLYFNNKGTSDYCLFYLTKNYHLSWKSYNVIRQIETANQANMFAEKLYEKTFHHQCVDNDD